MEESTIVVLLSIVVTGIVSGTVSGLSLWLTYRERRLPHRKLLYQKQIELYPRMLGSITSLTQPCYDFLHAHDYGLTEYNLTPKDRMEMRHLLAGLVREHILKERNHWVFAPREVMSAIDELVRGLYEITATGEEVDGRVTLTQRVDPFRHLWDAENNLYNEVRKAAHVKPISEQIRRIIGA